MEITDFNSGKTIQEKIGKITAIQTRIALEGSDGFLIVVDGAKQEIVSGATIIDAITEVTYDTICANALTALNTALAAAKTAAQAEFDALGSA